MSNTQPPAATSLKATLVLMAVSDVIREFGAPLPEGHLYAMLAERGCTLEQFEELVAILVKAGRVRRSNNALTWVA